MDFKNFCSMLFIWFTMSLTVFLMSLVLLWVFKMFDIFVQSLIISSAIGGLGYTGVIIDDIFKEDE